MILINGLKFYILGVFEQEVMAKDVLPPLVVILIRVVVAMVTLVAMNIRTIHSDEYAMMAFLIVRINGEVMEQKLRCS